MTRLNTPWLDPITARAYVLWRLPTGEIQQRRRDIRVALARAAASPWLATYDGMPLWSPDEYEQATGQIYTYADVADMELARLLATGQLQSDQ